MRFPVEGEFVATFLTMPTTIGTLNISMKEDTLDIEPGVAYPDRVRNNLETTDAGAIMGRFFAAVSWRNN